MEKEIKSWEDARMWANDANDDRLEESYKNPLWSFDCQFKLDFDGGLIRVASRFYPPSYNNSGKWEGVCSICMGNIELQEKIFDCADLVQLKAEVEDYIRDISVKVRNCLEKQTK